VSNQGLVETRVKYDLGQNGACLDVFSGPIYKEVKLEEPYDIIL
jgi:hypothetical protein